MTTQTRSFVDTLIAFVVVGLLVGIYFAANHDVDRREKAAVDAVQHNRE